MRIMGLDYGDKTIGIAVSDAFGWSAQPIETIRRSNENEYKQSLKRLSEIIDEYNITKIVLGYPKNMDNSEGPRCEKTKAFKERIEKRFPNIDVLLWDERLSTVAAGRALIDAGLKSKKRRAVIDTAAAVYILQGYLDSIN